MREILFRGKRTENGEWIYGDYCGIWKVACDGGELIYKHLIHRSNDEPLYMVDPETVGEYTGLTDQNGKKIFEGDIVKSWSSWWRTPGLIEVETYEVVCKHLGGLYLKRGTPNGEKSTSLNRSSTVEVIGNKWDNPELLEVK